MERDGRPWTRERRREFLARVGDRLVAILLIFSVIWSILTFILVMMLATDRVRMKTEIRQDGYYVTEYHYRHTLERTGPEA